MSIIKHMHALAVSALVLALPVTLAASDASQGWGELSAKQQDKLDRKLAGRVAGEPTLCVHRSAIRSMTAISDDVLLYEMNNGTVYANRPAGGCNGVTRDALITRSPSNSLCRGDIAEVRDLRAGISFGSCVFSEFTPYVEIDSGD